MAEVSGSLITRSYNSFRGVDFSSRGDEVSLYRSPDALNMWKNYKKDGGKCVETRPDVELLEEHSNTIFGLFFYDVNSIKHKIVHSGTKLYKDSEVIFEDMNAQKSSYFVYKNLLFIKDGKNYLVFDGETVKDVEGFIPRTTIGKKPSGGGTTLHDANLLTDLRKNEFSGDGVSTEYVLDVTELDSSYTPKVWVNDEEVTDFTTKYNKVIFATAPSEPLTVGQDNVVIQFKRKATEERKKIEECTLLEMFDNRVFFSGNPNYPNTVWHTSLNDPTWCSDSDTYEEGNASAVKNLVSGNNALWVFKEPSHSNTTVFYHNPTEVEEGKIYPSVHSSISIGCVGRAINFNDTICFLSERGLELISGDVTTEQAVSHGSTLVDSKLLCEANYKNTELVEWEGYLLLIIDNKVYLANSRELATVSNHNEYEWFYWEFFNANITGTCVKDGVLYLCVEEIVKENKQEITKYRIYTLTNTSDTREIESYWTTKCDEFDYPHYRKTTNKKGCVLDVDGTNVVVYAKVDNGELDLINKYPITKGYVVPRIKKKKWKSIQLVISSDYPLSIYSATLEAYVGAYVKR